MGYGAEIKNLGEKPNRLIYEKSPYLLQHAYNPVDWYPWGDAAFEKARRENKPIFLSIGYSTCHWCHVMEKESFEDPQVSKLMNETLVSIKVDREERPDLDHIYMTVCQVLTGSGGWPLTIIMTPDKKPFFAATYIPKENRFGRMGMLDLIPRIREVWMTRHDELVQSADKIITSLKTMENKSLGEELDASTLDTAYQQLAQRFDENNGGFSEAPKFPTPHNFLLLLRYWKRAGQQKALRNRFIPNIVMILRPTEKTSSDIDSLALFIKNQVSINGRTTAYVCLNNTCKLPTTDIKEMLALIK